ncbi:uncharacterized protein B0I36DRAFT_23497 [Microdochium trichocladiopsis]|uniref:Uncharacterized protein n=1 Tax=Microdochium trichocladiopsis TaxID=1682393 RepID=A0A9P8YK53_9PEZI|nr:uncharacterized protein B0I36DRAFT_23497 [Microdochium trichocladiopsis]KAH7041437.1 hypothetical protein B0I36DRAFT_23497 [Microdochium trichocladiopsis]
MPAAINQLLAEAHEMASLKQSSGVSIQKSVKEICAVKSKVSQQLALGEGTLRVNTECPAWSRNQTHKTKERMGECLNSILIEVSARRSHGKFLQAQSQSTTLVHLSHGKNEVASISIKHNSRKNRFAITIAWKNRSLLNDALCNHNIEMGALSQPLARIHFDVRGRIWLLPDPHADDPPPAQRSISIRPLRSTAAALSSRRRGPF